tara:strand:- start:4014 stop:4328 length:315 start_codon:yes stop_codon:yes gene_type:complete
MKDLLLKLLPKQYREFIELGLDVFSVVDTPEEREEVLMLARRIWGNLDTQQERRTALLFGINMLSDRVVTVGEWSRFGSLIGILGRQRRAVAKTAVQSKPKTVA